MNLKGILRGFCFVFFLTNDDDEIGVLQHEKISRFNGPFLFSFSIANYAKCFFFYFSLKATKIISSSEFRITNRLTRVEGRKSLQKKKQSFTNPMTGRQKRIVY